MMLTFKHLTMAMAALIDERRNLEYYDPHLVEKMSLEEMRAKHSEINETIGALKEAAIAALQQVQPDSEQAQYVESEMLAMISTLLNLTFKPDDSWRDEDVMLRNRIQERFYEMMEQQPQVL